MVSLFPASYQLANMFMCPIGSTKLKLHQWYQSRKHQNIWKLVLQKGIIVLQCRNVINYMILLLQYCSITNTGKTPCKYGPVFAPYVHDWTLYGINTVQKRVYIYMAFFLCKVLCVQETMLLVYVCRNKCWWQSITSVFTPIHIIPT